MRKLITFWYKLIRKRGLPKNSWLRSDEKVERKDALYEEVFGEGEFYTGASKDWRKHLPELEIQGFGDCVSFSRNNCAEIKDIEKYSDNEEINFSDLDLAVGSGTTKQGNTMRNVAEYARVTGVSLEEDCPYTYVWEQRQARFDAAKNKPKYKLGNWEWVKTDIASLKAALLHSPLQIGIGVGYNYNKTGVIEDPKTYVVYHAVTLTYIDETDKKYIFDHYEIAEKILASNYRIIYAMAFRDLPENWRSEGVSDEKFYERMIGKLIIRPHNHGEVYRVYPRYMKKVIFNISDKTLFAIITESLREKKAFIGVLEEDFAKLERVAVTLEGIKEPEESIDLKSLIN